MKRFVFKAFSILTVLMITFSARAGAETQDYSSTDVVKAVQESLNEAGYDCGTADGIFGNKTAEAIANYKQDNGLSGENEIDAILYESLFAEAAGEQSEESVLFPEAFEYFGELVSQGTYENVLAYVNGNYTVFETTAPSDEDLGQIVIEDKNGFRLSMQFYPDAIGRETLSLVSYNNGSFEGSVSDNLHMNNVKYGIYNINADPRNQEVSSIDEVISFVNEVAFPGAEDYEESMSGTEMLDVSLEVSHEKVGNGTQFTVKTNLPDETVLMLTLEGNGYKGQTKITVTSGEAVSDGFSNSGNPLSGHFTLTVSMSTPKLQTENVSKRVGVNGEFLSGPYVMEDDFGKWVSGKFEMDL